MNVAEFTMLLPLSRASPVETGSALKA